MQQATSLIIGRFQPFHLGHLTLIKSVIEAGEFALIVIGSKQISRTENNPLTASERTKLIKASLTEAKIDKSNYKIIDIADINDNNKWVSYLRKTVPSFNKVYTGTDYVQKLFKQDGKHPLGEFPFLKNISGTKIRNLIRNNNNDWQKLVSPAVADLINKEYLEIIKDSQGSSMTL
jgi:nicotinamide-nucleotide adenylyltransferase